MSKERETLITDLSIDAVDGFFYITRELQAEIRELLTQKREHTEQKPVVWQVIGIAGFMYVYNKPIDQVYEHHTVNALYLAPPKREPLGEEESYHEAKRLYEAEDGLWYEDGFVDGLKFAEKMHGIGVDDE